MKALFERPLCGVDSSPESLVAAEQTAKLVGPGGTLLLAAVAEVDLAMHAGWAATALLDDMLADARSAVSSAHELAPGAETLVLEGAPADRLLALALEKQADLVAVGTHGRSRAAGILLGSVTTRMLHDAPCSVLVARAGRDLAQFPTRICVGVDGSRESARAAEVARMLGSKLGAAVGVVAACGGKKLGLDGVRAVEPSASLDERPAVEALTERAAEENADLLVVGSRGLHGAAALGSVSERVAHRAHCSTLVVRMPEGH
jgi:nucleotide-binding universal stress UspA family protein